MKFLISTTLFALSLSTVALADATYRLDIPAQDLGSALKALGAAANEQVLFSDDVVAGLRSSDLKGDYTTDAAVAELLKGTALKADRTASGVWLIRRTQSPDMAGHELPVADASPSQTMRLAQAQTSEAPVSDAAPAQEDSLEELAEIVVTGTHIRGVTRIAAPSLTVSREDIDRAGYTAVEDIFDDLPQNFADTGTGGTFALEGGSSLATASNFFDRASGINLRGLGADSTLTLLNGTRRAPSAFGQIVDVSTIPLSVIERVEIVTGGRSAIYGSDAVAGVVNLVTRRHFEGLEAQASYGRADHGSERLNAGFTTGLERDRGGLVVAYEYGRDWPLNLVDTDFVAAINPTTGATPLTVQAQDDLRRHAVFVSGNFSLTDRVELYGDGLYTSRDLDNASRDLWPGAATASFSLTTDESDQYSVAAGARTKLGKSWVLDVSGSLSAAKNDSLTRSHLDQFGSVFDFDFAIDTETRLAALRAVADGELFPIGRITPRAAIGVERRTEDFESASSFIDRDRSVESAFVELSAPLLTNESGALVRRIELSLAGRYDDYSDFGGTFNPQVGLIMESAVGLALRGAYSKAYKAPALVTRDAFSQLALAERSDPEAGDGVSTVLEWLGNNPDVGPEKATVWSVGLDYQPIFAPSTELSLSYFDVDYTDRVGVPAATLTDRELVLVNEGRFPGLIVRTPTAAEVQAILDSRVIPDIDNVTPTPLPADPTAQDILTAFPDLVVFDLRSNNIAVETVRGLDATLKTAWDISLGKIDLGLNATYALEHERSLTATSPAFSLINEVHKPVDFRARANAGLTRGAWGAFVYLNYVDGYPNPFSTPVSRMDSWLTTDLTLRFDGAALPGSALEGSNFTLTIENLFDRDPPEFPDSSQGILFDPTNANPLGRYVSLRIVQAW